MFKILDIFRKSTRISAEKGFLLHRYDHFKRVLTGNNQALAIITDLEHLFYEDRPFSLNYCQVRAKELLEVVCRIAEDINALAGARFTGLFDALEAVGEEILEELERKRRSFPLTWSFPWKGLGRSMFPK